jgi:flagellar basal body-associated protein FliL
MSELQPSSKSRAEVRGLLWIALIVLVVVLVRAVRHHLLGPYWLRPW